MSAAQRVTFALLTVALAQAGCASLVGIGDPVMAGDGGSEDATAANDGATPDAGDGGQTLKIAAQIRDFNVPT